MLESLKEASYAKQKANITTVLLNLQHVCPTIDAEIESRGGAPVSSGAAYDEMQKQRRSLNFQLNGPMTMDEVREFVQPFLDQPEVGISVSLATHSVIDNYEKHSKVVAEGGGCGCSVFFFLALLAPIVARAC